MLTLGESTTAEPSHLLKCIVSVVTARSASNFGRLCCSALDQCFACSYVGGAPGKIDLYVGKEVVRRAIPMDDATNQLIELIKEHDRLGVTNLLRLETCTQPCITRGS